MLSMIVMWLVVDAILLATFLYMPVMRGEDAFFGVRVSPEFYNSQGREILNRYRFWIVSTFIEIEALGLFLSIYRSQLPYERIVSLFLLIAASGILHFIFYKQVKGFEVVDEKQRFASSLKVRRLGDYTNIFIEVAATLLTVAPILLLIYFYPELPEKIPVHWNWKGEPDRWAQKSFGTVFFMPMTMIYLQGLFLLLKHGMLQSKMTLPAEKTEEYLKGKEEMLSNTIRMTDTLRVELSAMMGCLSLNTVFSSREGLSSPMNWIAGITFFSILLIMGTCIYYIYKLVAIDRWLKKTVGRVYVQRKSDAEHWYGGGLFYYNPDDPSVFVEKLLGFGYTLNMGNKRVYIYIGYLALLPLLISWAMRSL